MNESRMPGGSRTTHPAAVGQVGELFAALEDDDCRALLQAAADDPLSASELSDACDLPLSTTYRKVDLLTDVGLLEERLRLSRSGKHTSEYLLCVDEIQLSLAGDGIDLEVTGTRECKEAVTDAFASAD